MDNRIKFILTFSITLLITLLEGCSTHMKNVKVEHMSKIEMSTENKNYKHLKGEPLMIVKEAFEWLGTPYIYGAQDKGIGTDCSGMVMVIYENVIGCKLPRNSAKQAEFCDKINEKQVNAGDLVFFITNSGDKINHVGIMIDNVQFIHASSKGVVVASMETKYYKEHFQKYGRVPCIKH